jgi:hypothetical protein
LKRPKDWTSRRGVEVPENRMIVDYREEGGQKSKILLDVLYGQPLRDGLGVEVESAGLK